MLLDEDLASTILADTTVAKRAPILILSCNNLHHFEYTLAHYWGKSASAASTSLAPCTQAFTLRHAQLLILAVIKGSWGYQYTSAQGCNPGDR